MEPAAPVAGLIVFGWFTQFFPAVYKEPIKGIHILGIGVTHEVLHELCKYQVFLCSAQSPRQFVPVPFEDALNL